MGRVFDGGIHSDKPAQRDSLDRVDFAQAVARIAQSAETPVVVGLYGGWGSGKTTLMRFVEDALDTTRALPVRFNAWRHQDDEAIPIAMMHSLVDSLGIEGKEEASKLLMTAAAAFGSLLLKMQTSLSLDEIDAIGQRLEAERFGVRDARLRLRERFESIVAWARGDDPGDRRIVFFVDDLDRCSPRKALEFLESLKLHLDLAGCVFVLGVDYDALTQIVDAKQHEMGRADEYLDKIIQLPMEVPPLSDAQIGTYIQDLLPDDLDDCAPLLGQGLGGNPRRIKRFINILLVNHNLAADLVPAYRPSVLMLYLLVQHRLPGLYRLMVMEPGLLADLTGDDEQARAVRDEYREEFFSKRPRLEEAFALEMVSPADCAPEYIHLTQVTMAAGEVRSAKKAVADSQPPETAVASAPPAAEREPDEAKPQKKRRKKGKKQEQEQTEKAWVSPYPDVPQADVVSRIRHNLEELLGARVHLRSNMGRSKIVEREGVLEETHASLFVVRVDEKRNRTARVSYSYVDILTGTVELSDPTTGETLLPWLN